MMELKAKIKGVKEVQKTLNVKDHRAISKGAINTAGQRAYMISRRAAKASFNLRKNMSELPFTKEKATATNLTFRIIAPTRMQNVGILTKGAVQTKQGVRVEIVRGKKIIVRNTFMRQPRGLDYSRFGQKRKVKSNFDLVLKREAIKPYLTEGIGDTRGRNLSYAGILIGYKVKKEIEKTFKETFNKSFNERLTKFIKSRYAVVEN